MDDTHSLERGGASHRTDLSIIDAAFSPPSFEYNGCNCFFALCEGNFLLSGDIA